MELKSAPTVLAKVRRRLIPFLFVLYIVSYLDRINVGFAALQMNQALGLSSTAFGLGAGMFFLSYTLFEIPSNVILARVGARLEASIDKRRCVGARSNKNKTCSTHR